ncbi:hypothetical protein PCI56_15835 [Plesiomonas shigelloides subsp. oncorhynchi]|nr:hypothetical protein [Plesiomonas shigelloides]
MAQASDGLNLPKVDLNAQVTRLSDPLSMDLKEIQPFPTLAPKLDQLLGGLVSSGLLSLRRSLNLKVFRPKPIYRTKR